MLRLMDQCMEGASLIDISSMTKTGLPEFVGIFGHSARRHP